MFVDFQKISEDNPFLVSDGAKCYEVKKIIVSEIEKSL